MVRCLLATMVLIDLNCGIISDSKRHLMENEVKLMFFRQWSYTARGLHVYLTAVNTPLRKLVAVAHFMKILPVLQGNGVK